MSDPLGRKALFSPPPPAPTAPFTATFSSSRADAGKEALYSAASRPGSGWNTVVLDCSGCGARSRLSWGGFAWRHLPFWLWLPWRPQHHFMSCPTCSQRAWLEASWFS